MPSGVLESYKQVSMIRLGAQLCRSVDFEGQSLEPLL